MVSSVPIGDHTIQHHLAVALQATGANTEAPTLHESVMSAGVVFDGKDEAQRLLQQLRGSGVRSHLRRKRDQMSGIIAGHERKIRKARGEHGAFSKN
jgi:hypothetical protein